jgi:protein SCO1/2
MPMISRRAVVPFGALALGAMALVTAAFVTFGLPGARRSGGGAIGGPFSLHGTDGRIYTDRDLLGRPFLVFFGFTHCPDVCPTTLFEISEVLRRMAPDEKIAAFYISVDPARDTPAVMKDYLASFDPGIIGLSGAPEEIAAVMKAYRVYARKVPLEGGDYTMDHTALVYLMDKHGNFAQALNLQQPPEQAARELALAF